MAKDLIQALQSLVKPRVMVREEPTPQLDGCPFLLQLQARPPAEVEVRTALRLLVTGDFVGRRAATVEELLELKKPCTATAGMG